MGGRHMRQVVARAVWWQVGANTAIFGAPCMQCLRRPSRCSCCPGWPYCLPLAWPWVHPCCCRKPTKHTATQPPSHLLLFMSTTKREPSMPMQRPQGLSNWSIALPLVPHCSRKVPFASKRCKGQEGADSTVQLGPSRAAAHPTRVWVRLARGSAARHRNNVQSSTHLCEQQEDGRTGRKAGNAAPRQTRHPPSADGMPLQPPSSARMRQAAQLDAATWQHRVTPKLPATPQQHPTAPCSHRAGTPGDPAAPALACTRWLSVSATNTSPLAGSAATALGLRNWPGPEPWLPQAVRNALLASYLTMRWLERSAWGDKAAGEGGE